MTVVTRAEFARLQGYDKAYVTRLAQAGRLVCTAEGRVDVEASRARIAETADLSRSDVAERHAKARQSRAGVETTSEANQDDDNATGEPSEPPDPVPVPPGNSKYQESRAEREYYGALRERLDYEKAAGKLVEVAQVERAGRELGLLLRQSLERIADVLAPEVAPETDVDRVHALIQGQIEDALRSISDRAKSLASRISSGG